MRQFVLAIAAYKSVQLVFTYILLAEVTENIAEVRIDANLGISQETLEKSLFQELGTDQSDKDAVKVFQEAMIHVMTATPNVNVRDLTEDEALDAVQLHRRFRRTGIFTPKADTQNAENERWTVCEFDSSGATSLVAANTTSIQHERLNERVRKFPDGRRQSKTNVYSLMQLERQIAGLIDLPDIKLAVETAVDKLRPLAKYPLWITSRNTLLRECVYCGRIGV